MKQHCLQDVLFGFIIIVLPALIVLKTMEACRNDIGIIRANQKQQFVDKDDLAQAVQRLAKKHQNPLPAADELGHKHFSLGRELAYALFKRRLDDPSFWLIAASAAASFLVIQAYRRLEKVMARWQLSVTHARGYLSTGFAISGVYILGYLLKCFFDHETFFYFSKPHSEDAIIKAVQLAEGVLVGGTVVIGVSFFTLGLRCIDLMCIISRRVGAPHAALAIVKPASLIASAGCGPAVTSILAFSIYKPIASALGYEVKWQGAADAGRVIGSVALFYAPFLILFVVCYCRLHKTICLSTLPPEKLLHTYPIRCLRRLPGMRRIFRMLRWLLKRVDVILRAVPMGGAVLDLLDALTWEPIKALPKA